MERPGENTLRLSESEGQFLLYVTCRINREVGRFQRGEQDQAHTRAEIGLLSRRCARILGNRHGSRRGCKPPPGRPSYPGFFRPRHERS